MKARAAPDLSLRDLEVGFTDRGKAFVALSLARIDVKAGSSLALTGPSGCGKSTLLYALAGLLKPSAGVIAWGADDLAMMGEAARDAWRRRNVGFIFQDFELIAELSAENNVLVPATFASFRIDTSMRIRARNLLDEFGVPARGGPVGSLSRGERQRVALARALLFDPPVILADEPTASLDSASAEAVISALAEHAQQDGRTLIAATHDPRLIERIDNILRLDHGRAAVPSQGAAA